MIDNKQLNEKYVSFSNNIKKYRQRYNLTQEQLAEQSDLSASYIKQIESGKEYKNVSLTTILKLSKTLNVEIEDLFMDDL